MSDIKTIPVPDHEEASAESIYDMAVIMRNVATPAQEAIGHWSHDLPLNPNEETDPKKKALILEGELVAEMLHAREVARYSELGQVFSNADAIRRRKPPSLTVDIMPSLEQQKSFENGLSDAYIAAGMATGKSAAGLLIAKVERNTTVHLDNILPLPGLGKV